MNLQVIKIRILSWLRKIILYGLYIALLLFVVGAGILQIPPVQKSVIKHFTDRLSVASGFTTTFESVYLVWYDRLQLRGLRIVDPEQNLMIGAEQLSLNFRISFLFDNSDINIDAATLTGGSVNLVKILDSDSARDLNINIFISRLGSPAKSSSGGSAKVNIGEILVNQSRFSYNDPQKDSLAPLFDYHHMDLQLDNGQFQNFKVIGDTIQFRVNSLVAKDNATQFELKKLSTFFRISQRSMEFIDIKMDAGASHIEDSVIFTFQNQLALNDFNNAVDIHAKFKNTILEPKDLALFARGVERITEPIRLEGKFSGKVKKLTVNDLNLNFGNTSLNGALTMDGLPAIQETFINLNLKSSKVDINDLSGFIPTNTFTQLKPLGEFQLSGKFAGFVNDFVANGSFAGAFGKINSDINLKIDNEHPELSSYSGNIEVINFKLNTYLKDTTTFKRISLKGNIKGKGFTEKSADLQLNGLISHFKIKNYDYANISTNARFRSQFFNGKLTIDDPNLKFDAEGSIDFRDNHDLVKVKARLDTVMLQQLGFSNELLSIRSDMDINSKGLQIDSIFGQAFLNNTIVNYRDQSLQVDSIYVISSELQNGRSLLLKSSLGDINLHGEYYYSTLFNDLNYLFKEFFLTIKNDKAELTKHYLIKEKKTQEYHANFNIILRNINPIFEVAGLKTQISQNTKIEGTFVNGFTSIFNAYSTIDSIVYSDKVFTENSIQFNGSKIRDSTTLLAMLNVTSQNQFISKNFNTQNLIFDAIWNTDHIEIGLDFDQPGTGNYARAKAAIDFLDDSTRVKVLPSQFKVLDEIWEVSQHNYTIKKADEWAIHELGITHGDQSIFVDGYISPIAGKSLLLKINNLELDFLNTILGEKITGLMNGSAEARDLYTNPYIQNNLTIESFTINDFLIGDVVGVNTWNQQNQRFDIDFSIDRLTTRTVDLSGYYNPNEANPLQLDAKFNKANLKIAEPLLQDIFLQLGGELTGTYSITGNFSQPKIDGNGKVENGEFIIAYLKTRYSFTGEFGMNSNQMIFNDFKLSDVFNNKATVDGYIAHKSFSEFRLNLDATFANFQLLNTTPKDNSEFYGQGYGTGNANIFGPASNLKISATARTEKNTRIYIPMTSVSGVETKDFINFIPFTDSIHTTKVFESHTQIKTPVSGISMDINLDITPDAYAEIIFDIKSGDIIRGRGNGDIKLQVDTKGDFFMFGSVEFTQGAYNFTLYDIINKEFDVQPGSRISWYGNPYEGIMDITANYRQMASLIPLLTDQSQEVITNPQVRRKYPSEVKLKLDGQMLSPRISFDIEANELPDNILVEGRPPVRLNFEFESFKSRADEQELKRQVFSLIILRRFSPPDAFSTSGTLYSSVSELLSNQLSYWLTQVDQNLEVDLDLGTLDQEAFNTFQLRLSYSFLNGRLRVTRDGSFANQYQTADNVSSLAGDWTVDYLLTPDGKFKVKMYSRSNLNQLNNSLGTQNAVTTGVSLLHTQNFDQVKDLWRSAREKNQTESTILPTNDEGLKEDDDVQQ